jgi:hypothetical protein
MIRHFTLHVPFIGDFVYERWTGNNGRSTFLRVERSNGEWFLRVGNRYLTFCPSHVTRRVERERQQRQDLNQP